jgi:hypothetical protein
MKKIISVAAVSLMPLVLCAQDIHLPPEINYNQVVVNTTIILALYFASVFIIALLRSRQDFLLKSKLIDKGVPDEVVSKFLQPQHNDIKHQVFKWFLVLTGIGAALTLIYYTLPLGIHSAAIMAFCIAASFLGYYFFLKRSAE